MIIHVEIKAGPRRMGLVTKKGSLLDSLCVASGPWLKGAGALKKVGGTKIVDACPTLEAKLSSNYRRLM